MRLESIQLVFLFARMCSTKSYFVIENIDATALSSYCRNLIQLSCSLNQLILVWDEIDELKLELPFILQTKRIKLKSFQYRRIQCFVLNLPNPDIRLTLSYLESQDIFDARAKFIVITDSVDVKIFEDIASYDIYNVVVLEKLSLRTFSYNPYSEENLHSPNVTFFEISCNSGTEMFPNKIPRFWRNTTLNVSYLIKTPFFICSFCPVIARGLEGFILEDIRGRFKFKVHFRHVANTWGVMVNGSYTGNLAAIRRREVDTALGNFHPGKEETKHFDLATPIAYDALTIVVPISLPPPLWMRMLNVFRNIWMWILGSMVLYFGVRYTGDRIFGVRRAKSDIVLDIVRALFSIPIKVESTYSFLRILILHMNWFAFLLGSVFISKMVEVITSTSEEYQIDTLEQIAASNLVLALGSEVEHLYKESATHLELKMMKTRILCDHSLRCLNRTAFDRDIALVTSKETVKFLTMKYYLDSQGQRLVHITKNDMFGSDSAWYFRKGFPMFYQVDRMISKLRAAGLYQLYYSLLQAYFYMHYGIEISRKSTDVFKPADFNQLNFVFYALISFHFINVIAFLGEIVCYRIKNVNK